MHDIQNVCVCVYFVMVIYITTVRWWLDNKGLGL